MPPVPSRKRRDHDGQSRSNDVASFGRGIRWRFSSLGTVRWSLALSLPLGLIAIFLVAWLPSLFGVIEKMGWGGFAALDRPGVLLGLVWLLGLMIQVILTQLLFTLGRPHRWLQRSRRGNPLAADRHPEHDVTVTLGGVWMAIPESDECRRETDHRGNLHESATQDLAREDATDEDFTSDHDGATGGDRSILASLTGASRVLFLWSMLLMAMATATMGCLSVDFFTDVPNVPARVAPAREAIPLVASIDRPWVASAWIFCLQGFWQLLPIPQSLGRVGWSAAIGLFSGGAAGANDDERSEAVAVGEIVRWWVIGFAIVVWIGGVVTIMASGIAAESGEQAIPVFAGVTLLAGWLWFSTRSEDLFAIQMTLAANGETGVLKSRSRFALESPWKRWRTLRQERQQTKNLRETLDRERSEANDAARVDEVLRRLHAHGPDSLSEKERAILNRVSEAIRRERERDRHAG